METALASVEASQRIELNCENLRWAARFAAASQLI